MPKNKPESDEKDFQAEIRKTGWFKEYVKEYGEEPDLNTSDYDYRSAWKAGVRPVRDPYDKNRYHWSSSNPETGEMLKSKDHPTAWKEDYMKSTGKNPDEVGVTKEQYMKQAKPKMAMGGSVESPVSVPVQPPPDQSTLIVPKFGMAKGGTVAKQTQRMLKEGGMMQEGGTVDPVSGNDVPVGAMQEEVRDDIPAQLSEGEFVFPADVVRFIGLERLMMMRQAAKEGLGKMEAMGQMSNADEATEEDDGAFESQIDEIMGELGEEEDDVEMAVGGMATEPAAMAQTQQALAQDQQPQNAALTEDQLSAINRTADGMRSLQAEIAPEKQSKPTEGLSSTDIIKNDRTALPDEQSAVDFTNKLAKVVAAKKAIMARHNDTIFVGLVKRPGVIAPLIFSQDNPGRLVEALEAGFTIAKDAGIKRIEADREAFESTKKLRDLGYNIKKEDPSTGLSWSLDF